MKAIIFNGSLERRAESTSGFISGYFAERLTTAGIRTDIFTLADSGIPLFDVTLTKIPLGKPISPYIRVLTNGFRSPAANK